MISKCKKNYKVAIVFFVLGIIVSGLVVYAATIESKNISYDNRTSGISSTSLQGAIDDLYTKVKTHCPDGYTCTKLCKVVSGSKTTVGSEVNCGGENFYISTTGSTITLIAKYGLNSSYRQSTTPTPVNYTNATTWIENYAKNTLSSIKGNMSFYGHTTEEEVVKLATGLSNGNSHTGTQLSIGGSDRAYWIASEKMFFYMGTGYASYSISNDATSYSLSSLGSGNIYARPMVRIPSSVISDL